MQHQQRAAQPRDPALLIGPADLVQEGPAQPEGTAADVDRDETVGIPAGPESGPEIRPGIQLGDEVLDVVRGRRRTDDHDGLDVGKPTTATITAAPPSEWPTSRSTRAQLVGQPRATASRSATLVPNPVSARFPAGVAEPGEVDLEHGDTLVGQRPGDPGRRVRPAAAREAVGEQRRGPDLAGREIEDAGEALAVRGPGSSTGRGAGALSSRGTR